MATCTERTVTMWDDHVEACACTLPIAHVFNPDGLVRWHRCSCGCAWVDDQQIDEARRGRVNGPTLSP